MANQIAEIIDLKMYRERKAGERLAIESDIGADFTYGPIPQSLFAMPVAFFVFWPTWIFTPQFASLSDSSGNGAA